MHIFRFYIIVEDSEREAANNGAVLVTNNPADAATYSVPLSSTGQSPATHWACSTVATYDDAVAMATVMQSIPLYTVKFYRCLVRDGCLDYTNSQTATVGEPFRFEDALADLGLQRVEEPL
jgi:hypothetical protein